jgi:hypothetical protein
MTVAPSAWNSLAVAAPMPVVPPVIRAILPSSFAIRKGPALVGHRTMMTKPNYTIVSKNEEHDIWTC